MEEKKGRNYIIHFVVDVFLRSFSKETFNSCNMIWPEPKNVWSTAFILYTATLGFFGPLLIICLCYLLIIMKVRPEHNRLCTFLLQPSSHLQICGVCGAGEVLGRAGGSHQTATFGAQGDPDGGGDRGGVCALLAALLHHQHGQSGGHHPRIQHHCRDLLFRRRLVVRQLLRQPGALRLPVR